MTGPARGSVARIDFDEPVATGEMCCRCQVDELAAIARYDDGTSPEHAALFVFVHARTGRKNCSVYPEAEPFDHQRAARAVQVALRARAASEKALAEALGAEAGS